MENKPRYKLVKRKTTQSNNQTIPPNQNINIPELITSIKRSLYSDIDARAKYWMEQRIGLLLDNNALMKKNTTELKIDYDNNSGGLSWIFKHNGSTVAYVDSQGFLYCSNILINGVNLLNAINNIVSINNDLNNLSDIYVRHVDLKNGKYKINIKDIISATGTINSLTSDSINTGDITSTTGTINSLTCDSINTKYLYAIDSITCDGEILAAKLDIANNGKNTEYIKARYEDYLNNNEYIRLLIKDLSKKGIIDFTRDTQFYKLKLYIEGGQGIISINESGVEIDGVVDVHNDLTLWQKLYVNNIYAANTYITLNSPTIANSNLQVSGQLSVDNNITSLTLNTNHLYNDALSIIDMSLTDNNAVDILLGADDWNTGNSALISYHHNGDNNILNHLSIGLSGYLELYKFYRDKANFTKPLIFNINDVITYPIDLTINTLSNNNKSVIRINDGTQKAIFGLLKDSNADYCAYIKLENQSGEINIYNNKVKITPTLTMNHDISGFCDSSDMANNLNIDDSHLITAQAVQSLNPFTVYDTHTIKTVNLPTAQYISCLCYSPVLNIWLILPNTSRVGAYSEDNGETWNIFDCALNGYYRDVCWCDDVGQFFAVYDNTQYAILSNTGKSYESVYNMGVGVHNWICCASGNGITIAANYDSSNIFYFQGGSHARSISLNNNFNMTNVVFGAGLFLGACAQYNTVIYSYDGITWDTCGGIEANTITDLFYGTDGCFIQLTGTRKYQLWRCKTNLNQGNPGPKPFYSGATQYLPDYGNNNWYAGAYGNGRYVVLMNGGDKFAVNINPIPYTDGWVLYDISTIVTLPRIKFGNGSFIIISQNTTTNNTFILNFKQYKTDNIIISNNLRGDNNDRLEALEKQIRGLRYSILNSVYPIGSIYINGSDGTDPEEILGFGTWTKLSNKFLYCVDSGAGATGGNATHSHKWRFAFSLYDDVVNGAQPLDFQSGTGGIYSYDYATNQWNPSVRQNYTIPGTMHLGTGSLYASNYAYQMYATGGTSVESSLPPYVAVYGWIRTA